MANNSQDKSAANTAKKQPSGRPFKKGQSGNPKGKLKGTENFKTLFKRAIEKLAKDTNEKPDEILLDIVGKAIGEARNKNIAYYKDLIDRLYGKPKETIDHTTDGEKIEFNIKIIESKNP